MKKLLICAAAILAMATAGTATAPTSSPAAKTAALPYTRLAAGGPCYTSKTAVCTQEYNSCIAGGESPASCASSRSTCLANVAKLCR